jgi:hypothetical protein
VKPEHQNLLRRLAVNDRGVLEELLGSDLGPAESVGLDGKSVAFVRLAGLVALGAGPASYQWGVAEALAAGATDAEVVGVLMALGPVVGTARLSSAVPDVALALGCDLDPPGVG